MLTPTAIAVLGAFAVTTIVFYRRDWHRVLRHGFAAACGFAIPAGAVVIYLIQTDILRDMPTLYHQISRYAAETPWEASDYCKPFVVLVIALFPVMVRGWIFRRDTRITLTLPFHLPRSTAGSHGVPGE